MKRMSLQTRTDLHRLEDIPNVGSSIAGDLRRLGITTPSDLPGRDPYTCTTTFVASPASDTIFACSIPSSRRFATWKGARRSRGGSTRRNENAPWRLANRNSRRVVADGSESVTINANVLIVQGASR